jgi:hypothetical protein
VQLKNGRLVVSTSSTVWAQTLQFMSEAIRARLDEQLGPGVVLEVVFRHAGWEDWEERTGRAPAAAGSEEHPTAPLSADQQAALERVAELALPEAVREQIARAMRAAFARAGRDPVR